MNISIDILNGNGNVEGMGTYESGTPVSIIITPSPGFDVKHVTIKDGDKEPVQVEKSAMINLDDDGSMGFDITTGAEDMIVGVYFYVSIESYLQTKTSIDVSRFLQGIRTDRNIEYGADVDSIGDIDKKLCEADLYMCLSSLPTTRTAAKDADGGWSHQGEGITVSLSDKQGFIARAMAVYKKYDPEKYEEVEQSMQYKKTIVEYSYSRPSDSKEIIAEFY